ncbi:SubName: Full=Uncharacterized protein {ECO:0000313/EMBL:CCA72910.1} [Serendipita indica DSM 11827]|nr:SubName: Full=Uncharacterized protein {ECO:0000313/EMBL:CCA72910.1} [Serendipita indica DSM 11827]
MRLVFFALLFAASALGVSAAPLPTPNRPVTHRQWERYHNRKFNEHDRLGDQHMTEASRHEKLANRARKKFVREEGSTEESYTDNKVGVKKQMLSVTIKRPENMQKQRLIIRGKP